jgi:uncharacterized protein (TIGR02186 family)
MRARATRVRLLAPLAFFASLWPSYAQADQPLLADLSSHLIAITTGFTGASVVLFGATDGPGDVVIVVRGPERDMVVRHKSHFAGIWINTRQVTFSGVPSYYAVFSSKPLDDIVPQPVQSLHQIGLANLHLQAKSTSLDSFEVADFRNALIDDQRRQGVYDDEVGRINFLGDRLFRAQVDFPATVPTGTYFIEVLLIRDGNVVTGQTTPLVVSQVGVDAEVGEFAEHRALIYGLIAVASAAVTGYIASLPFRNA